MTRTAHTATVLASIAAVGAAAYAAYYARCAVKYGPDSPNPLEIWVTSKVQARRIDREWYQASEMTPDDKA